MNSTRARRGLQNNKLVRQISVPQSDGVPTSLAEYLNPLFVYVGIDAVADA